MTPKAARRCCPDAAPTDHTSGRESLRITAAAVPRRPHPTAALSPMSGCCCYYPCTDAYYLNDDVLVTTTIPACAIVSSTILLTNSSCCES
ncbi:hypothetical protein NL676_028559 [Syzygium grande]|nr:hypothetical protein NL676_028559 [Syzygium grande]